MNQESKQDVKNNKQPIDQSKRKLGKVGLLGAPILMTVGNKPAWAQYCNTDSGKLSGNLSNTENNEPCEIGGEGLTPGWWKNGISQWVAPKYLLFNDVFPCNAFKGNPTLIEVLSNRCTESLLDDVNDDDCLDHNKKQFRIQVLNLAYQAIAALQNALSGEVNYLYSAEQIITDFCASYSSGRKFKCEYWKNAYDEQNNFGVPGLSAKGEMKESPSCSNNS